MAKLTKKQLQESLLASGLSETMVSVMNYSQLNKAYKNLPLPSELPAAPEVVAPEPDVAPERLQPPVSAKEDQFAPQFTSPVEHVPLEKFESGAVLSGKAKLYKQKLDAEPRVRVYIPLSSGEKMGVTQFVCVNGYPMHIMKGQYVPVPESIAAILEEKLQHNMLVASHKYRIGGDGKVELQVFGQ